MNQKVHLPDNRQLVVVSNRLPITIKKVNKHYKLFPASGGLITALDPLLQQLGGAWVGWPGCSDKPACEVDVLLQQFLRQKKLHLVPVYLNEEEILLYYQGFSNEILWPLFHDLHSHCHFIPEYWEAYKEVNRKFCKVIEKQLRGNELIWVHDYHLMLIGQQLKCAYPRAKFAFFLHTPFAPPDIFMKIPWRDQLLKALLQYDQVGFQTKRDTLNFLNCVQSLVEGVKVFTKSMEHATVLFEGHATHIGTYPISIDYTEFAKEAAEKEVVDKALAIRETIRGRKLVFSVDRLDMTKGIPYRLEAIRYFLHQHPEWHEKVTFNQVVVPSRTDVRKYKDLKEEIDKLVSEINAEFTTPGWIPIHYMFQSLSRKELLAYYQAANVMWVTSIKDGMNLVAKEYPASKHNTSGILLLSEFAGSAFQLAKGALLVNPYSVQQMSEKLQTALQMSEMEQRERLHILQQEVQENNIYRWIEEIFRDTFSSYQEQQLFQGEATPIP